MSDRLRVDVDGGKYTVVMAEDGRLYAERYGEPWRECVGDNLIGCMAGEIEELREQNSDLLAACEKYLDAVDNKNVVFLHESTEMIVAAVAKARSVT